MSSLLIWDCGSCKTQDISVISKIQTEFHVKIESIIVLAKEYKDVPSTLGELAIVMPIITRYGENAMFDAIVDAISILQNANMGYNVIMVSDVLSVWISLFQQLIPKKVFIVSNVDQQDLMDLTFLPEEIELSFSLWENLMNGKADQPISKIPQPAIKQMTPLQPQNRSPVFQSIDVEEEEDDILYSDHEEEVIVRKSDKPVQRIQHLTNLEENIFELKSPAKSRDEEDEKPVVSKTTIQKGQSMTIPKKFQVLVEAMKRVNKAMISLKVLTEQMKAVAQDLGVSEQNVQQTISKATEAGLVVFDATINYIRFRNREMEKMQIQYE